MSNHNSTTLDFRIFGFTELGQLRVSLFNGPDSHAPGALYSWIVCATVRHLAHKLAAQWEQSLNEEEWAVLEELEQSNGSPYYTAESEIICDTCGGSGADPGGLNAYEPEDCPACLGTGRETVTYSLILPPRKPVEPLVSQASEAMA
jgi:hypothetical protein